MRCAATPGISVPIRRHRGGGDCEKPRRSIAVPPISRSRAPKPIAGCRITLPIHPRSYPACVGQHQVTSLALHKYLQPTSDNEQDEFRLIALLDQHFSRGKFLDFTTIE